MKKSRLLLSLTALLLLPLPTSCSGKTAPYNLLRLKGADGRLAKIYSVSDLHRMIDCHKTFALAVTDSSSGSDTLLASLRTFVLETEAVIYEISLSLYTELDTSFGYPRLSANKAPALLLIREGKIINTYTSESKASTTSKKFINTLRQKISTSEVYTYDDYNGTTSSYYFYQNTAGRLETYLAGSGAETEKKMVVFYDPTVNREDDFVHNYLFSRTNLVAGLKFEVIDISYYKYDYDESSHQLSIRSDYQSFANRFSYGFYNSQGTPVTPALNFYQKRTLKKTLIYGHERLTDSLGAYEVVKKLSDFSTLINEIYLSD